MAVDCGPKQIYDFVDQNRPLTVDCGPKLTYDFVNQNRPLAVDCGPKQTYDSVVQNRHMAIWSRIDIELRTAAINMFFIQKC